MEKKWTYNIADLIKTNDKIRKHNHKRNRSQLEKVVLKGKRYKIIDVDV